MWLALMSCILHHETEEWATYLLDNPVIMYQYVSTDSKLLIPNVWLCVKCFDWVYYYIILKYYLKICKPALW